METLPAYICVSSQTTLIHTHQCAFPFTSWLPSPPLVRHNVWLVPCHIFRCHSTCSICVFCGFYSLATFFSAVKSHKNRHVQMRWATCRGSLLVMTPSWNYLYPVIPPGCITSAMWWSTDTALLHIIYSSESVNLYFSFIVAPVSSVSCSFTPLFTHLSPSSWPLFYSIRASSSWLAVGSRQRQ